MTWFTKRGQRVWGEGGYAVALTAHGWTPEDDDTAADDVEADVVVTVEHQAYADLTPGELADVDQAIADEGP